MSNRKVIILTIAVLMGMIIVPTIYKVHAKHNEMLLLVVEKEFWYYAKLCYYEGECSSTVTLDDLYEKEYITTKLANPITKKYYDGTSYVDVLTGKINFNE